MVERWVFAEDCSPARSWQLLAWCRARGAEEFTVSLMRIEGAPSTYSDEVERDLAPFALEAAPRELLWRVGDEPWVRRAPRWRLTDASLAVLHRCLPDGLFTAPAYRDVGWAEELVLYRAADTPSRRKARAATST